MALPQEEMVPQSQLVLCTAIEEIPRPSRHLSEPEDHLFNLPCSKQVSAIHRDALQEVNKAVCQVLARTIPCKRGSYKSKALDPAQRCEIGTCASEHGISTAQKKFGVPRTTVWKLKKRYEKEKENSVGKLPIVKLDRQKRGRPTILGAFIDGLVCQYVLALRSSGGVVNGKIVRAVAHALVLFYNPSAVKENGGSIVINRGVSKSIFRRMDFTKRKGTKTAKKLPENFADIKTKYLLEISQCICMHGIPEDLVINMDETGVSYTFTGGYTMEKTGSKQVSPSK